MGENGYNAKAITKAKYSVWVKKYNCLKHAKKGSIDTIKLFYAKNGCEKQLIFEKWEHFEICQKWPQCKGYSTCKILSLDEKLKMQKRCENVSKHTLKLLYAKNGSEKQLIFEKWEHFENGQKWPKCKAYTPMQNSEFGSKNKIA